MWIVVFLTGKKNPNENYAYIVTLFIQTQRGFFGIYFTWSVMNKKSLPAFLRLKMWEEDKHITHQSVYLSVQKMCSISDKESSC